MRSMWVVILVGLTVAGILGYWIHPLLAAGCGVAAMFPTAFVLDRRRR